MGRPRLYNTPEERKQAMRRDYEKWKQENREDYLSSNNQATSKWKKANPELCKMYKKRYIVWKEIRVEFFAILLE
jgi:hypothetical protein